MIAAQDVTRFELDARALAAEHGHTLGDFASSASILTGARCVHCHRSAALGQDGAPLPGSLATSTPCTAGPDAPRYLARPAAKRGRHYVIDRDNPAGPPVAACKSRAAAVKMAAAMSAPAAPPAPAPVVDDRDAALVKARAKVKRAAAALARAERDLDALTGYVPAAVVVTIDDAPDVERLAPVEWAVLARSVPPFVCSARTRRTLAAGPRVLA